MNPIEFPECNSKLAKSQPQFRPLPVFIAKINRLLVFCLITFIWLCFCNLVITSCIFRFKHPSMTETQLFKHLPSSFIWNLNN